MDRVAQRAHQHGGWHDDQGDAEENQDRRGKSLLSSHLGREVLVQRIERDGQDQCPDHQCQERREDLVAKHDQRQDEAGTDEYVQQPGFVETLRFGTNLVLRPHGDSPGSRPKVWTPSWHVSIRTTRQRHVRPRASIAVPAVAS